MLLTMGMGNRLSAGSSGREIARGANDGRRAGWCAKRGARWELVAADVRWRIDKTALVRQSGSRVDRYESLPVSPVFTSSNGLIVLHIGEFEQAFAPIAQGGAQ